MGCLGESFDLLKQGLHLLDWSKGIQCTTMPKRYLEPVLQVVVEKQLEIELQFCSILHQLPAKQALQFDIEWDISLLSVSSLFKRFLSTAAQKAFI